MIKRDLYIRQLKEFIDKPFIKVITGIRRSGKSGILMLLREELLARGVAEENIIYINFESFQFSEIDEAGKLYEFIRSKIKDKDRYYILLDEIQTVASWEKAVNSFLADFDTDIYITGSNSRLLSSELSTFLAGRYIEIQVFTLSFAEHILFRERTGGVKVADTHAEFENFLQLGGFPALSTGDYSFETAYKAVYDIYSSAILRDTVQRHNIRDVELLERVVRYVFDNVGNRFSARNIADYFKSQQRRIDLNTVYNYLNALESAFIIYRIPDMISKGKRYLRHRKNITWPTNRYSIQ